MEKFTSCRYSDGVLEGNKLVHLCSKKEDPISDDICENCTEYKPWCIIYPITVSKINNKSIRDEYQLYKPGALCAVKPCDDDKTYLGLLLGELPTSIYSEYDVKTQELTNGVLLNPAIYVFELKKIVYGCESWWTRIKSEEDFHQITDKDIENTWYVKLLREMQTRKDDDSNEA